MHDNRAYLITENNTSKFSSHYKLIPLQIVQISVDLFISSFFDLPCQPHQFPSSFARAMLPRSSRISISFIPSSTLLTFEISVTGNHFVISLRIFVILGERVIPSTGSSEGLPIEPKCHSSGWNLDGLHAITICHWKCQRVVKSRLIFGRIFVNNYIIITSEHFDSK